MRTRAPRMRLPARKRRRRRTPRRSCDGQRRRFRRRPGDEAGIRQAFRLRGCRGRRAVIRQPVHRRGRDYLLEIRFRPRGQDDLLRRFQRHGRRGVPSEVDADRPQGGGEQLRRGGGVPGEEVSPERAGPEGEGPERVDAVYPPRPERGHAGEVHRRVRRRLRESPADRLTTTSIAFSCSTTTRPFRRRNAPASCSSAGG